MSLKRSITLFLLLGAALCGISGARAQTEVRPVRLGVLNLAPVAPLLLLPQFAKEQGLEVETVQFQRFADARTALASGDIDVAPLGPQDISLAVSQGVNGIVGIAGISTGGDCLVARKDSGITDWASLKGKTVGVGAGSISWLKFAASVQEAGISYPSLKVINIAGGGAAYTAALQRREIDLAVVWQPFCAQAVLDGYGSYPALDHNGSQAIGGSVAILAANRAFLEKNAGTADRLVASFVHLVGSFKADRSRWAKVFAERSGLPEEVAAASLRNTDLDERLPLRSIKRISRFLAENGVISRDVSGELDPFYDFSLLQKATGRSPEELGR